jgi:methionyl-tRNA formyltransferase
MVAARNSVDFVHAFVLHPHNIHRYGGYESPLGTLKAAGVSFTLFDETKSFTDGELIVSHRPHYVFVCGLRQLIPVEFLWRLARENNQSEIYSNRSGVICFHPSALPDGAGLAPVQWTLFERCRESKVSSFLINDIEIDGGPVINQRSFAIGDDDDAGTLDRKIGDVIAESFREMLPQIAERDLSYCSQDTLKGRRRVRPQITPNQRWLDFNNDVERVLLEIRAFTKPYGGATALIGDRPTLVYKARVEKGAALEAGQLRADGNHLVVGCANGVLRVTSYEFLDR